MTSFDQHKAEEIIVESIKDLSASEQAELIADKFSEVANEYEILKTEDIAVPEFCDEEIPQFTEAEIQEVLSTMDTNKSNVNGDISVKVLKNLSKYFTKPVTHLLNASLKEGKWPDIFKMEIVTPVPKQFPPKDIDQLRNISGLLNLDKIAEKLVSRLIISDMKENIDPSQFANQKGLSIQHYLIKFIDRILQALDKNKKLKAVLY